MRLKIISIAVILLVALSLGAQTINWLTNIEDALQKAKASDKHVFVFFTGSDWCSWCDKLQSEVFKEKAFQDYVQENMVMVMLDFPRAAILSESQKTYNDAQQQKYNIQGYPSVIILDTSGEVVLQTGYREGGASKYVKFLQESLDWKFDASNATWKDDQGLIWQKNFEIAQKIAKKEGKSIFINFTGSDWCVWCHRLTDEVFSQPEFVEFANRNLVLVRFDFPKQTQLSAGEENYNMKMAQKYGVKGFPTLFLTDSAGNIIQKLGYEKGGAVPYTNMLRDLIK
ncbi:MAG: thioredoxin family protein [Candidatus Cloacimonetes bacterium]|nr:thioredoxin family protein [Candidatus Cloacimonadota bacterium]